MVKKTVFFCWIVLLAGVSGAQIIQSPFQFIQSGSDTTASAYLPSQDNYPISQRVVIDSNGHFALYNLETALNHRIRFFGTELDYTAQFLSSSDANVVAKRLRKLGFNAVRLVSNDETWWPGGSLFNYTDVTTPTTSYDVNAAQLAKLDTLIAAFKKNGIYTFLVLQTLHTFSAGDGVSEHDSIKQGQFVHFYDTRAAELHRQWAKTLLTHSNPITGLKLANEPALAAIEVTAPGLASLFAGWRFGNLNWVDQNNSLNNGAGTICWNHTRRLDTLYSQYLLKKYGSDNGIQQAWQGPPLNNAPNQLANGNFEQIGSTAWSFGTQNGAIGVTSLLSPGYDSQYCMLVILAGTSPNPNWYDAYLINSTARLGKDTLYQLSFYAKIQFDPAKPVLSRSIYLLVQQYDNYTQSLSTSQTIDTNWKKYTFTFRAQDGGLQQLYFGLGSQLGNVMIDAVSIKQQQEYGFIYGETSSNYSIYRVKFGETDLLPRQRVRDLVQFYDSLQNNYFIAMKKCISDTIGSQVLVNFYAADWWSTLQDQYANRYGDFAQAQINTDYPRQRNSNAAFTDSTWVMSNNSLLSDQYNGAMGALASASISGKPFIGRYMNLVMNQQAAAQIPFFTAYASHQDWDGLFFVNYANYYEDLFANYARQNSWWTLAGNPSLVVQLPQASDAFRNQRIKPSAITVTVSHDDGDILLESIPNHYNGNFGVDGYLDPNITTLYKVRESFNAPSHKVAAQYPYNSDTSTKISDTKEISWSQSGNYLLIHSEGFSSAEGIFGIDTVRTGTLRFRKLDPSQEMESITLTQSNQSSHLLTIASRSQNFHAVWQYNDSSIGNKWGTLPTIMSAGKFEFYFTSDSNRVYYQPLDQSGIPTMKLEAVKLPGTNTFKFTIDESFTKSPWYYIQESNTGSSEVIEGSTGNYDLSLSPNPASDRVKVKFNLSNAGIIRLSIFDDLGREISELTNGEFSPGDHEVIFGTCELFSGHYSVVLTTGNIRLRKNLNVIR